MGKLVVTIESSDGEPSKSTRPLHCDEVLDLMRDLVFRAAASTEIVSISITHERVLDYLPKSNSQPQE